MCNGDPGVGRHVVVVHEQEQPQRKPTFKEQVIGTSFSSKSATLSDPDFGRCRQSEKKLCLMVNKMTLFLSFSGDAWHGESSCLIHTQPFEYLVHGIVVEEGPSNRWLP